jgi:hypothetical protein
MPPTDRDEEPEMSGRGREEIEYQEWEPQHPQSISVSPRSCPPGSQQPGRDDQGASCKVTRRE